MDFRPEEWGTAYGPESRKGFETRAVHAGWHKRAVNPPISRSSTYRFESCDDGARGFASKEKEQIYSRFRDETVYTLEKRVADLEGGFGGIATASGMAAVNSLYSVFLSANSHAILTGACYGTSRTLLEDSDFFTKFNISADFVDTSRIDNIKNAIRDNTKLIFIESPANPTLSVSDISKIASLASERRIPLAVDNTFCSPYLQNPLMLGADIVLHSTTKSINGHSNAIGGIIVTKNEEDYNKILKYVRSAGPIMSSDVASLTLSGLSTLPLRMEKMQSNMLNIADSLSTHPNVSWINYLGFKDHVDYEVARKQMRGPGNMMTFGVRGGYEAAKKVLDNLKVVILAVSLGGVESLISHPASMTHASIPREDRIKAGIKDDLIGFSAGIEDFEDLIEDFNAALR